MIAWLKGKIAYKTLDHAVIDVNDVGYQVFMPESTLQRIHQDDEIAVYVHEHIREDNFTLYGFTTTEDLAFFKHILSVKGVGPKIALAIISMYSVDQILAAIANEDVSLLKNVSGIGLKSAQRIILELKGKISHIETAQNKNQNTSTPDSELAAALQSLGYSAQQIAGVLPKVTTDADIPTRLRQALQELRSGV